MKMLAHLKVENGIRKEQMLKEHCMNTAKYVAECMKTVGLYNSGYLAGILHDMGKATEKFNTYLEEAVSGENVSRGSVNHTFAGVIYLLDKYHKNVDSDNVWNMLTSEIISHAIGSHHGIFDCVDLEDRNGFIHRLEKNREEIRYEEALENFFEQVIEEQRIDVYFQKSVIEVRNFYERIQKYLVKRDEIHFQIGLLCRMLLSALIYGDRRDTGEFMNNISYLKECDIDWKRQRDFLENNILQFDNSSMLNQVRSDISRQCVEFSDNPTGIYRLNVPTGAGKTLCSLRYALAHAEKFNKKRIIFIIPLLSILDQNAKIIRDNIADGNLVLEHHSNVVYENDYKEELEQYDLLAENWNSPIIVSTMVQLLNILFTHKTSAIGRMRALSDSVIVIDEIQSLPKKVTLMFNEAMNFLSKYYNTTIVLSSATQPCLEEVEWPIKYAQNADMVHLSEKQLQVFHRAEIINKTNPYGMDIEECISFCYQLLQEKDSVLIICNTKKETKEIFEKMQEIIDIDKIMIFHLSTSMCQQHRKNILTELLKELSYVQKEGLKSEKDRKVICIATQLVEAGVDFSFQCVVRVMAGIDNLAQAAGRCNRSNEYNNGGCVYLINLKNENLKNLPEIQSAQISTRKVLMLQNQSDNFDLTGEAAANHYYKYLYQEVRRELKYPLKEGNTNICLANLLANSNPFCSMRNENYILRYPFKKAGCLFKVFDDNTIDVIVPYEEGAHIISQLRNMMQYEFTEIDKLLKEAKSYTISVFQWQKDKLMEYGYLEPCCDNRIFLLSPKVYDDQYGLGVIEEQRVEDLIL